MRFSDIIGNDELKETLHKSVKDNHVAHALMFSGREGGANLAMALAFAQFVNCENPSEKDSCGVCASCVKYEKLIHPDLMLIFPTYSASGKDKEKIKAAQLNTFREFTTKNPYQVYSDWTKALDAEKKQCIISVDEGRNIAKNVSLKAFEAKYKVVLVWLPEFMNQACANSILKILEEPPEKTLYLLVTNDFEKNITTILSRSQIVNVPLFSDQDISSFLENKHFVASKRAKQISKYADGSLRNAILMINEVDEGISSYFIAWMRSCYSADIEQLVPMADDFTKKSRAEQLSTFKYGLDTARELLLSNAETEELKRLIDAEADFLKGFSKVFNTEKIMAFSELFNEAYYHIERNLNSKILFLDLSLSLAKVLRKK